MKHKPSFLSVLLSALMIFSIGLSNPVFASDSNPSPQRTQASYQDLMRLEPYIKVVDHKYVFDKDKALEAGFSISLVEGQEQYLHQLNTLSEQGALTINSDLSTTLSKSKYAERSSCAGKSTPIQYFWWGYSRFLNNCEAKQAVSDLNTAAASGAAAGGFAAIFPGGQIFSAVAAMDAGYWWLVATRIDANNQGRGVYIGVTWLLFFDVEPQ